MKKKRKKYEKDEKDEKEKKEEKEEKEETYEITRICKQRTVVVKVLVVTVPVEDLGGGPSRDHSLRKKYGRLVRRREEGGVATPFAFYSHCFV